MRTLNILVSQGRGSMPAEQQTALPATRRPKWDDNRLAATLIAQGRDVLLIPLYTPLRTDELDVSQPRVYYGGVNAYLQQIGAFFRRTPRFLDRLLDARPLLRFVGRFASSTRPEALGPLTLSVLRGEHGAQRKELEKLIAGL